MAKKNKKKIFIVEDSEAAVIMLCKMLENSPYMVCGTAASCNEAVKKISKAKPEAVIMDIRLEGGENGIDVARKIKEMIKIPMVYTSAFFSAEILEEIRRTGGQAYIIKPVRKKDLIASLDIAIWEHAKIENLKEIMTSRSENIMEEMEDIRKYEFMANTTLEYMTLISKNYIYESANDAYCRAHGKERSKIVGRTVDEIWGNDTFNKKIKPKLDECFSGKKVHYQDWLDFPEAGKRFFEIDYYPYRNKEKNTTHAVVITRNITERKIMEKYFRKQEKLAGIGRLAAGVAHELNNPLTTIIARTDLLLFESGDTMRAEDRKALSIIKEESLRMKKIIGDLSSFSKKKRGLDKSTVALNDIIRKVQRLIASDMSASGIIIDNKLLDIPPLKADSEQLMQVFINLFSNCADALKSRDRGNKNKKTIRVSTEYCSETNLVRVRIKDNGEGMGTKTLKSLFEPFFTTKATGTGLGLSIVYGIIQDHGGDIRVESGEGEYTEFIIEMPLESSQEVNSD